MTIIIHQHTIQNDCTIYTIVISLGISTEMQKYRREAEKNNKKIAHLHTSSNYMEVIRFGADQSKSTAALHHGNPRNQGASSDHTCPVT